MDTEKAEKPTYYRDGQDLRFAFLTEEQEATLFARMHGDDKTVAEESRTFLIENHLLFAQTTAKKIARKRLPDDEVISAANSALMNCIDRFQANRGARFTTYLRFFIRRAVMEIWQSRDPVNYKRKFPVNDDTGSNPRGELKPLEEASFTPDYAGDEFKSVALGMLEKFKEKLSEEERELLRTVYEDGLSFAEIGRRQGLSREAIRNHHNDALAKLRKYFKKAPELE